jgi:hypothetical protein
MERVEQKMKRRIQKQRKWFELAKENGNQA